MMKCSTSNLPVNKIPDCFSKKIKFRYWKLKWIIPLLFLLMLTDSTQAQETGPLLMKQELGYTLGGSVFGSGLGVVVWFMDPLNPSVTLRKTVENGFIVGTVLGALLGFYMLQNAMVFPPESTLPENLDQLLGMEDLSLPIHRSMITREEVQTDQSIKVTIFGFRF